MRYRRLLAFGLALIAMLMGTGAGASEPLSDVRVVMQERAEGSGRVLIPTLTGHPDAGLQQEINRRIIERLRIEDLLRILERSKDWVDESGASGVRMEGEASVIGSLLSLAVSIQGELPDGTAGHLYAAYNCDLLTGQEVELDDLFAQPEQAIAHMEALALAALEREGLNAYLERVQIAPLPRRDFAVDAQGLTVYYPKDQYRLIGGKSGAFFFPYHQIEAYFEPSPITEALLAQRPAPADPAGQIRLDMANGELPGIPARLGAPMAEYIARYGLMDAPDYTLDGPLYQFEAPRMQGVRLSAAMYPADPDDRSEAVINIRATLIDLYGLRPGSSTLQNVADLLGPPDEVTVLDAGTASDMLLPEGESFWYHGQGNRLQFHGDQQGILAAVILHAGD
ncbi:MAG: hypothetical protein FWE77_06200 [Clostridia bacterium]|nr:hypothetical protein [Clostridia bacterium]